MNCGVAFAVFERHLGLSMTIFNAIFFTFLRLMEVHLLNRGLDDDVSDVLWKEPGFFKYLVSYL